MNTQDRNRSNMEMAKAQRDALVRSALSLRGDAPLVAPDRNATIATATQQRLRGARRSSADPRGRGATLVLHQGTDGVLHWRYEPSRAQSISTPVGGYRASARKRGALDGLDNVLIRREVQEVGPNQVSAALKALDDRLNNAHGLKLLQAGQWQPVVNGVNALAKAKRVLLLVHGTFSSSQMYLDELGECVEGTAWLQALQAGAGQNQGYDAVLAFDHPTLCVGPLINAVEMELALVAAGLVSGTEVDLVAHSRGGVVSAWWAHTTRFKPRRLVAVGSPLKGTSLASPYRIRYLLDYLANISILMGKVGQKVAAVPTVASPFLAAGFGLAEIFGRFVAGFAQLPVVDGAVAMIPGLHAQARLTNNFELDCLQQVHKSVSPLLVFTVASNFEPKSDYPWWNVIQRLRRLPVRGANALADRLFPGKNDLVVDVASMDWYGKPAGVLTYDAAAGVHHCAYFRQDATVKALRKWLA